MMEGLEHHIATDSSVLKQIEDCLTTVLGDVEQKLDYRFDGTEVLRVLHQTLRKIHLNGKNMSYIPLLFETELEDFVTRKHINIEGRSNQCAKFAGKALV